MLSLFREKINGMIIKELKELIKEVPDNFEFEIEVSKKTTEAEQKESSYPYPYNFIRCKTDNKNYHIDWSDKKMKIDVRITES